MKILNLYCGIGGNRKLWGDEHEITAVEYNQDIAAVYKDFYPNDTVIVGDAHEYLLKHFQEFDFIWASPPCPSHSRINTDGNQKPRYPDMKLYEEIVMLSNNWFKGRFCIENVIPYYEPLVKPTVEIDRHLFWSNFNIPKIEVEKEKPIAYQKSTDGRYGFNLNGIKISNKVQILRNLVNPEIGKYILDRAMDKPISMQGTLFENEL
ncbi:MAG: DNA cytosine methyltransferase [Clostridia bacterium]|nr:DNA cytosine methyltransferase [Clostridia bacterium]